MVDKPKQINRYKFSSAADAARKPFWARVPAEGSEVSAGVPRRYRGRHVPVNRVVPDRPVLFIVPLGSSSSALRLWKGPWGLEGPGGLVTSEYRCGRAPSHAFIQMVS